MQNIADINHQIAKLKAEKDQLITHWFEKGEADRSGNLPPQHQNNYWYMMGYNDRDYQLEIGSNPENPCFEQFQDNQLAGA